MDNLEYEGFFERIKGANAALVAEQAYHNKEITLDEFYAKAKEFLECGSPLDVNGCFICEHCMANFIVKGNRNG